MRGLEKPRPDGWASALVLPIFFVSTWVGGCDGPLAPRHGHEAGTNQHPAPAPTRGSSPVAKVAATPSTSTAPIPPPPAEVVAGPPVPVALVADAPIVDLDVDEHGPAAVSLPLGATRPMPVAVAAHGNYDRPEWQCQTWREIFKDRAFILCPRGLQRPDSPPGDPRFKYATNRHLEAETRAGLAALQKEYGDYVDPQRVLWVGFSQGAIMGTAVAIRDGATFPTLILVEGGHDYWNMGSAKAFADAGGTRVLFACGEQTGCPFAAKTASKYLDLANVETKIVVRKGAGHSYAGPLAEEVSGVLDWVLDGDARWAPPTP